MSETVDWEQRYRTLEVIAQKRLDEMMRLIEENRELRYWLGNQRG